MLSDKAFEQRCLRLGLDEHADALLETFISEQGSPALLLFHDPLVGYCNGRIGDYNFAARI